jgi:hypothetical protein
VQVDIFGVTVFFVATAGFLMIAGGIALLWKGAITLAATPNTTAISIEYRKMLKINTQVPGIAFFVIGTALLIAAPVFAGRTLLSKFELTGITEGVDGVVTVSASRRWPVSTFSDGEIHDSFYPDTSMLTVEIGAAGYKPIYLPIDLTKGKVIPLGSIRLLKQISEIKPDPANIAKPLYDPPAITERNGFGSAQ